MDKEKRRVANLTEEQRLLKNEYQRKWRLEHPEHKAKDAERTRQYRKENKEKVALARKENFAKNKDAINAKRKDYRKARVKTKTDYINNYLLKHPCAICGETNLVLLDFDHIRGKKKMSISLMRVFDVPIETLIEEIEKCQVLCCSCHRIKTYNERGCTHRNITNG